MILCTFPITEIQNNQSYLQRSPHISLPCSLYGTRHLDILFLMDVAWAKLYNTYFEKTRANRRFDLLINRKFSGTAQAPVFRIPK